MLLCCFGQVEPKTSETVPAATTETVNPTVNKRGSTAGAGIIRQNRITQKLVLFSLTPSRTRSCFSVVVHRLSSNSHPTHHTQEDMKEEDWATFADGFVGIRENTLYALLLICNSQLRRSSLVSLLVLHASFVIPLREYAHPYTPLTHTGVTPTERAARSCMCCMCNNFLLLYTRVHDHMNFTRRRNKRNNTRASNGPRR